MKKRIFVLMLMIMMLLSAVIVYGVENTLYEVKQTAYWNANIRSNYVVYYSAQYSCYLIATSSNPIVVDANGNTNLDTNLYMMRIDYYNGNLYPNGFINSGYGTNIFNYFLTKFYASKIESNCTVTYEESGNPALNEDGTLRNDEPDIQEVTMVITADVDNIQIEYTNHEQFDEVRIGAYKFDWDIMEWDDVESGYIEEVSDGQVIFTDEQLEYGISYGFKLEGIIDNEVVYTKSSMFANGWGNKYKFLNTDSTDFSVVAPRNLKLTMFTGTFQYEGETFTSANILMQWRLDMDLYNLEVQFKQTGDTTWQSFEGTDSEGYELDGIVVGSNQAIFIANYDYFRVRSIHKQYNRTSEWVEIDVAQNLVNDTDVESIIPEVGSIEDMELNEIVESSTDFVASLAPAFGIFGYVYSVLPQPIPQILGILAVMLTAWFALKLLRG